MALHEQDEQIMVVAGPCAVESEEQTLSTARQVGRIRDIVRPMNIHVAYRGGAWKPRTEYHDADSNRVFEGTREEGLGWLAAAGDRYDLPIFTECMSEQDLRHFGRMLDFGRDYIQVGARTSKAYALLHAIGGQPFGVLLKSPEHGVSPREAVGSLSRMAKNRDLDLIYCIRGQVPFIDPDGRDADPDHVYESPTQHPDARNLNNMGQIRLLRNDADALEFFEDVGVRLFFDPSHTFGGANDEMRCLIGRYAVEAITSPDYAYDGLLLEVNDRPDLAKCDGAQATLISKKGVDWSRTNAGQPGCVTAGEGRQPNEDRIPYSLIDIMCELVNHQAHRQGMQLDDDLPGGVRAELREIEWHDWAEGE
jgi:hypothetical protein